MIEFLSKLPTWFWFFLFMIHSACFLALLYIAAPNCDDCD